MSESWDQESTKMARKKRACSEPELYSQEAARQKTIFAKHFE